MTYELAGARGTVPDAQAVVARAQAWAAERHAEVLLADASVVFGRDHLESAVRHAVRARSSGVGVARDLGLETLRYLCAQRQVADAIRVGGLKVGTTAMAVVAFGAPVADLLAHLGWTQDDDVLSAQGKSLAALGVRGKERATVPSERAAELALERTALVDLEK